MRARQRAATASLLALILLTTAAIAPVESRSGAGPSVSARLVSVACNPGGTPGLQATAAASVTGGSIRSAQLFVGEFGTVGDPAYAPFPWTGMTLANWMSTDSWRAGVAADSRTLTTPDAHTWNTRNHAIGLWSRSAPDSWWIVSYWVSAGSSASGTAQWYVRCPGGSIIDGATLSEIEFLDEEGLR